jgi:predicted Zn-dependent protease
MSSEVIFAKAREALDPLRQVRNLRLRSAAGALALNRLGEAEIVVSKFLQKRPGDPEALVLQAEIAMRAGRNEDAEAPLAQCVARAPEFTAARFNYANVLF